MTSFLQIVTNDLIQRFGLRGLEQLTLVFPMQRAGLFLKQHLSNIVQSVPTDTPVVLPHFTTIDALCDSLCELQSEEEITSVCTLYQVYQQHTQRHLPIDAFYGWGVQLMNDFSNADMALVDMHSFIHYTAEAKGLEQTLLDEETRQRLLALLQTPGEQDSIRAFFTDLWQSLPAIYTDFQAAQQAAGVGTRGARYRWTLSHFHDAAIQQRIAHRTYVFVGFNYLQAAERQLMQAFHSQQQALFYWDIDPSFHLDDTVYHFIRENLQQFPNALPDISLTSSASTPSITAMACQSSAAQAQYVHEWLACHKKGDQTAIVIADESQLQAVIYALPEPQQLDAHINITKGYSLHNTLLYAKVNSLIQRAVASEVEVDQLIPSVMADLESFYLSLQRPDDATWQAVLLDESYGQIQRVLRQMLLLVQHNTFVRSQLTQTRVLGNLLRRKLKTVTIPFHGEPITDIQIIGVLETRLLDFDHVLILNVEEDVVPSRSNDQSFLPYDLRRAYGMATREEESRIYAYNFFRLMRRASDVTLLFSDSFTDQGKRTMSRFLMQMLCSPDYTIHRQRLTESADILPFTLPPTCLQPTDACPTHLSPSSISTYIECPREFYLKQIQQLTDSTIDQVMLPVSVIGSLCHAVLRHVYLTICHEVVDEHLQLRCPFRIEAAMVQPYIDQPSRLSASLDWAYHLVNEQFAKYHPQAEISSPYVRTDHEAENHAILEMARKVLRYDCQLAPFTLVWLEHFVTMSVNNMRIEGIIDRLDIVGTGEQQYIRVLDYKTGGFDDHKIKFSFDDLATQSDKKYALQTLAYCEMVRRNLPKAVAGDLSIRPELFFLNKHSESDLLILSPDKAPVLRYDECQSSFMTCFEAIVHTIQTNCQTGHEFLPQPDEAICASSYCPFHLLCGRARSTH